MVISTVHTPFQSSCFMSRVLTCSAVLMISPTMPVVDSLSALLAYAFRMTS